MPQSSSDTPDQAQPAATDTPEAVRAALRSPLADKLGITIAALGDGTARLHMPFDHGNTTVADIVHGGAILSLADSAATAAVWSTVDDPRSYRGLTIDLSLSFLTAARSTGLTANARLLKRGRSICYCEVDVTDDHGELAARATAAYKLSRTTP